uniref:TF-B3 domain-containing protein n=1 Tax=Aegilops tauschii subsp. strangulata TaxID=200361 RepID=A0A453JP18_AEGTS
MPCNERNSFNNLSGDTLKFKANKRTYTVNCHKGPRESAMYGSEWRKFVSDNKLGKGQLVLFYLDQPSPRVVVCVIQFGNDTEDEGSKDDDDYMEVSDEEDEDGEANNKQ